jgi:hypothetical protein
MRVLLRILLAASLTTGLADCSGSSSSSGGDCDSARAAYPGPR